MSKERNSANSLISSQRSGSPHLRSSLSPKRLPGGTDSTMMMVDSQRLDGTDKQQIAVLKYPVKDKNIVSVISSTPTPHLNSRGGLYDPVMNTLSMCNHTTRTME